MDIGGKKKIVAALNDVICVQKNPTTIELYPNYRNTLLKYTIKLTPNKFEGLIKGSKIDLCLLLPYCRQCKEGEIIDSWRLVIITNKCQVFHNFPNRSKDFNYEGESQPLDLVHFEESAIWDIPGRKYPSMNEKCDANEFFFPVFDKEVYEYHPRINGKHETKYGNKGFPKYLKNADGDIISRFYFPKRQSESNPFFYLDGLEIDTKITLVGTYRSNTNQPARIVVFATTDGGRNWFAKYEFGDYGQYDFRQGKESDWGLNFGNSINITNIEFDEKDVNSLEILKRELTLDFKTNNYQSFSNPISIKSIVKGSTAIIETHDPHGLTNGNIVLLKEVHGASKLSFLTNNNASEFSPGNGIFFKVKVIDNYRFELYENVSNTNNVLPCRHIHFIDRIRDGWTIGTGEIYPNGWLLIMQSLEGDTYSNIKIREPFNVTQLTFGKEATQRGMGLYLFEREKENYFIFASDHDLLKRDFELPNGDSITRNSTGVFVGKISNIDDYKKMSPIYETNEPCLYFKLIDDTYIFGGQRGEIAFGHNYGDRWESSKISKPIKRFRGRTYDFLVYDSCLFIRKNK
ncbi:MAG: hypothetical protein K6C32_03440 [Bacilli bacterium]|nr:hypothetical protein [Bacilli bacterium]